jgi:RNA polymerase sigma factor (sigma-70 family)
MVMPVARMDGVIRQLRHTVLSAQAAERTDAELLERYIAQRDERAFEALLRRHGAMVLGVCRRLLRNRADVEDAFQATFVVFLRKAASIRPRGNVANWLYGVAHRTALKANAMNRRRRDKEKRQVRPAAGCDGADGANAVLLEALDAELSRLPEMYRTAVVLCDLEGRSYREAAAQVGCPQGTLSGRLTRARILLARRLAARGITLTAAAWAIIRAPAASASVPTSLFADILRLHAWLAGHGMPAAGVVSERVASLSKGVIQMLLLSKLKLLGGVFVLGVTAALVCWLYTAQARALGAGQDDGAKAEARARPATPIPSGSGEADGDLKEAQFVFRGNAPRNQGVKLVVADTVAPVLTLAVAPDLQVYVGDVEVHRAMLRPGTRVRIRMDASNSAVRTIRTITEDLHRTLILASEKDIGERGTPSIAEVLRALGSDRRVVPGVYNVSKFDVQITCERIVDKVDPPRFFPLIGPARLHHVHWKCTVRYTEAVESQTPFPFAVTRPRVDTVYIDKDYLVLAK